MARRHRQPTVIGTLRSLRGKGAGGSSVFVGSGASTPGPAGADGAPGADGTNGADAGIPWALGGIGGGAPDDGEFTIGVDPVTGALSLNISETDHDGGDESAFLPTVGDSTSDVKGYILQRQQGEPSAFILWQIEDVATDEGDYVNVPVSFAASHGSWSADDVILTAFYRTGDKGADGADGPPGDVDTNDFRLLHWVRAVSTDNLHGDDLPAGTTIDDVDLEADDRVLVTWGTGADIYVIQASGDAVLADDVMTNGAQVWVGNEGSVYGNTGWAKLGNHVFGINVGNGSLRAVVEGAATASPLVIHERGGADHQLAIGIGLQINPDNLEVDGDEQLSVITGTQNVPDPFGYGTSDNPYIAVTYYNGDTSTQSTYWTEIPPSPGDPPANIGPLTIPSGSTEVDPTFASKDEWDEVQLNGSINIGANTTGGLVQITPGSSARNMSPQLVNHSASGSQKVFLLPYFTYDPGDPDPPSTAFWGFTPVYLSGGGGVPTVNLFAGVGATPPLPADAVVYLDPIHYRAQADS